MKLKIIYIYIYIYIYISYRWINWKQKQPWNHVLVFPIIACLLYCKCLSNWILKIDRDCIYFNLGQTGELVCIYFKPNTKKVTQWKSFLKYECKIILKCHKISKDERKRERGQIVKSIAKYFYWLNCLILESG